MRAIEQAAELASSSGAELHVVQGCGTPVFVSPYGSDTAAVLIPDLMQSAEADLAELRQRLGDDDAVVRTHVRAEGGAPSILDVANEVDADLIVVGNRGMTGLRRALGSVPNTVAHQAECAVLIVQTD